MIATWVLDAPANTIDALPRALLTPSMAVIQFVVAGRVARYSQDKVVDGLHVPSVAVSTNALGAHDEAGEGEIDTVGVSEIRRVASGDTTHEAHWSSGASVGS